MAVERAASQFSPLRPPRDSLLRNALAREVVATIVISTSGTPDHATARAVELIEGPFPGRFPVPAERGGRPGFPVLVGATAMSRLVAKTRKYTPQDSNL